MPDLAKSDLLAHEDVLADMARTSIYYPPLPPWWQDADDLLFNLWNDSPLTDGEKAAELIRDVFLTQASFAVHIHSSLSKVERLLRSRVKDELDATWDDTHGGPADRFNRSWKVRKASQWLADPAHLTLARGKLLCRPEDHGALLVELTKLRDDPTRWLLPRGEPAQMLGTMLALAVNNYSCWTDQWRPSYE